MQKNNRDMIFNLQYMSVLKAHPPLSHDNVFPIYTFTCITVSIHCAPEMSEIDCIGRNESFWPKFVSGW